MVRTQIQFPDPLYRRLKAIAQQNDWPLAEVVRRASELYVQRFADVKSADWTFPVLGAQGDYLIDPACIDAEGDAVDARSN